MMLCTRPMIVDGRAVLSASDSVWNPIEDLPEGLSALTDDLGNNTPTYAGTVFTTSPDTISEIQELNIMLCMRCVRASDIPYTDCPLSIRVTDMVPEPLFMGWDIVRGNGWVSASCDGYFPINSTGEQRNHNEIGILNNYSLFDDLVRCLEYCERNNKEIPEWAPWYPVAIFCDSLTKSSIDALIKPT